VIAGTDAPQADEGSVPALDHANDLMAYDLAEIAQARDLLDIAQARDSLQAHGALQAGQVMSSLVWLPAGLRPTRDSIRPLWAASSGFCC
jgi:hypothetical protein